ncbi:MAG: trypsin-like peptidase domain-containing protein [Elusimicrobiaceae bacterium]|nr:trypsin-like peptidase domain-containing protein [Elusimicrobiaceae bacterium]
MLFNLTSPILAVQNNIKQQKEEQIFKELNKTLEVEYKKKAEPSTEDIIDLCLKKNNKAKCSEYVNLTEALFLEAVDKSEKEQGKVNNKEEEFLPISKKEYLKQLAQNTQEEYKNKTAEIEEEFKKQNQKVEQEYKNINIKSKDYAKYAFKKSDLNNWKKESLSDLAAWKKDILSNGQYYYDEYLKEFEKKKAEYEADREEVFNAYLREMATNLIAIYDKKAPYSKLKMTNLLVVLLSTETEKSKIFTKEQRSKVYRFLKEIVSPNGLESRNPCRFHLRQRTEAELDAHKAYRDHLQRIEEQTQGTLSARDQIAKQSRPFEQSILNETKAPILDFVDEDACQAAFSALNGLSFFKGWDMSNVAMFMLQNSSEPIADQALLMGAKTLIETNRLDYFYVLQSNLVREANKHVEEDLKFKEKMFFNDRFYRTPYIYSRYTQENGGGDAWQDIAKMLSKEKTSLSKQVQQLILDHSVYFSSSPNYSKTQIYFRHNIPFIYGLLINNPGIIDNFVPNSAIFDEEAAKGYSYKGHPIFIQYFDDRADLFIKDSEKGNFYLADHLDLYYDDGSGYATIKVGALRKNIFENYKKHKGTSIAEYKKYIASKNLKASAVYAQAFYEADFVDLTLEEKLALDAALEKKYPHLKKISKNHKAKLAKHRDNLNLTTGIVNIIDVGLTLWCVTDIYKAFRWGAKGIKALRTLITAGKTTASFSTARKMAFFRNLITENKRVLSVHRNLKKIKSIESRIVNKFPTYRRMKALSYLAEKNGMNTINYMVHNMAYNEGKTLARRGKVLKVEGSTEFFSNKHYVAGKHKDIFRVKKDVKRAGEIGVSELGEGGQVVSYIDKAKVKIFKDYTDDFIKGQEGVLREEAKLLPSTEKNRPNYKNMLSSSKETTLLPREYLYDEEYSKILPFAQDRNYTQAFKIGDEAYAGLRKEGYYVMNTSSGEVFNDFAFHFDGYLNKNNFLGGLIVPSKNFAGTKTATKAGDFFAQESSLLSVLNPQTNLFIPGLNTLSRATNPLKILTPTTLFTPKIPKLSLYFENVFLGTKLFNLKLNNLRKPTEIITRPNTLASKDRTFIPGEPFPEIKAEPNYSEFDDKEMQPVIMAINLNILLEELRKYAEKTILTDHEITLYNNIANNIYKVLDNLPEAHSKYMAALEDTDFFTGNIPLITFEGTNVETIRPATIEGDVLVYSLAGKENYKKFIADKIKHLSSFGKEYTIYLSMHGDKNAKLAISHNTYTSLNEILDIVAKNKGKETVNIITSACHSGAALSTGLAREGINVLLLSGRNDLCYTSDMQFVKINDLRSSYVEAVRNRYYGSYLIYDGKFFNTLVDANSYLEKGDKRKEELSLLRQMYFKENIFGDIIYQLLINFPNHFKTPFLPFIKLYYLNITPSVFNPIYNIYEHLDDYVHILDPIKHQWEYVVNSYDKSGALKKQESVVIEEGNSEINNFLTDIAQKELKNNFPNWNYIEQKIPFQRSFPLYPHTDDEFLHLNSLPKLKKDFPVIPTQHLKEKKAFIITKINKNIERLKDLDLSSLSSKKIEAYQEVFNAVKEIAKAPSKATIPQLQHIEKMSYLLNMDKPVLILKGEDLNILLPGHIPSNNFRILNLSKEMNHKQRIGMEIKDFAKVFDKFTVWVDMHGSVEGSILVSKINGVKSYTRIAEIVRIIEANKAGSKVDLISASCHGGAGFISRFKDSDINILILSGTNEVCYQTDKSFLVIDNLPETYLNAVEAGRYGSYLIYNGKVYNPLQDALKKAKGNEELSSELGVLGDIFLRKDSFGTELGKNIFKLLVNFENYRLNTKFENFELTKFNKLDLLKDYEIPFVFNPILKENTSASSYLTKRNGNWKYVFRTFDKKNNISLEKGVSFNKLNSETADFIYESSRKRFPGIKKETSNLVEPKGQPNDLILIKTPKTITKLFKDYGLEDNFAGRLANVCFEGEKEKYNPVILEKIKEFLVAGVEPKYIDNMIVALSDSNGFSLDLYNRAIALHKKHNIPLPLSAYFVNTGLSVTGYDPEIYDALDKLLENNFDFAKTKTSWDALVASKLYEKEITTLGIEKVDILSAFSKGGRDFDVDAWNNLIYISKQTEGEFSSFHYAMHYYLGKDEILKQMPDIIGVENVAKALKENYVRYSYVFPNLQKVIGAENMPLLKEQIANMPLEKQLEIINTFAAMINVRETILSPVEKKKLIEKISDPQAYKEQVNQIVFRKLGWDYSDELGKIFDFSSNKYLMHILNSQNKFYVNLNLLYQIIRDNQGKSVSQILDELPENKKFAEMCAERGIDYQAWRSYDPKDYITRKVLINGGKEPITRMPITVRKVNMDNIPQALITGNESRSCRSVGRGICGEASPNLIRNKMVQQVEIVVEGRAVGNALIYLAEVDGQTSIVVGSFVKKPPYFSYEITRLVLDYVRHIRDSVTNKNIPIYYSNFLPINNHYKFPLIEHQVMLIGDGFNEIFNSFTHQFVMPYTKQVDKVKLFTIDSPKPLKKDDLSKEDILAIYAKKNVSSEEAGQALLELCFEGDHKIFNPDVLEAEKYLLDMEIDPRFVKAIMEKLSINGYFSKELYDKTLEFADKYSISKLTAADLIGHCVEEGKFSPKIYSKLGLLFKDNTITFSKVSFLENCKINGVFREDLFDKGLKVSKVFDRYTPQIIADFTDAQGNFNEEYFEAVYELLIRTQDLFATRYDAIKTYVLSSDVIQNAFDLLGTEMTIKYISLNKDRYLNIFGNILDSIDKGNMALLKEKLAPLPEVEKIKTITMLAGTVNKKNSVLGKKGITDLINKVSEPEVFKEEINRLAFKQLGLEYSEEMAKIFDFASSKYISRILEGNAPFDNHLKSLFESLKANIDKPIHQNFDLIPENQAFAKICAENGINYQAWRSYDPNDFIARSVLVNEGRSPITRDNLLVRKVDMDNVIKALTSGNESGACRAVGRGVCKDAAPELVKNKMVQQIEILRGNIVVGNALIYLAKVNGEVSIVIGSIIKKSPRYISTEINDLVADYVRKIRQDIGRPDIPIYMSSYLKVPNPYSQDWDNVVLLGSGDKKIFNSFTHSFDVPSMNKTNRVLLYQVDEGLKGQGDYVNTDYSSKPTKKDMLAQTAQKIEEKSYQDAVRKVKNQIKKAGIKSAGALAILCFEGEELTFNPAVLETIKDLAKKDIEGVFIIEMIKALSPNNHFEPKLYEKALELYKTNHNMNESIKMIKGSMEKGVFNPKILEKFQELQGYYFPLSEYDFMKACFVNGFFREDLYDKGISIAKEFTSSTPEILKLCKTEEGAFDDKLFENFVTLAKNTAKSFSFEDPLLEYLIAGEGIKFSLEVIGVENTAKAINLNKARYKNVFLSLADNIYKENIALLKAQLEPLPLEEKLSVLNQLSGILNKEKIPLTIQEEREIISQISDKEKFKETINRLSFKYFGFDYMPSLAKIFDFSGNRYLPLLFKGNNKFNLDFKRIYTEIKQLLTKSLKQGEPKNIHQLFDEIPENKAFAKICAERGIDYQAWRSYDPNDFIKRDVLIRSNNASTTKKELIARKVDMDEVIKGLTTGNESKACRAVASGENCEAGPELVRNKMVQQVELLDNKEPVGNVLVYLGEVNGQTAIVMGTIMKKGVYDTHEIDELFIDYVRAMRSKIGRPDIPIYMSRIFSIDNVKKYPVKDYQVKLLGSGNNRIFNSFAHEFEVPSDSKVNTIELYKVDEGLKGQNDFVNTAYPGANNISSNNSLLPVNFNFLDKLKFLTSPVFKIKVFKGPEALRKRGTGFYIKYRNFPFILTVGHLFKDADLNNIRVYNNLGFSEKAELLNISDKSDLAVLALPQGVLDRFTPWTLSLKEPRVGDDLLSIGYPKAKIKKTSKVELLSRDMYLTSPERNGSIFYQHEQGKIYLGASGSPLSNIATPKELVGVSCAVNEKAHKAISVPLPQIRTFLGETIKKILFTPDLSSKFLPLYPAFAKNYENVVNKFIYPSELAKKPSEKVKGTLTKKEQSIRLKRRIPEYFLTSPGYFRGMELNSLEELETILKEGLPVSKTSFDGVYFTPDIGLAFIYADNNGVKERISVLLKNINYKELTPINPPAEYASTRDVLPKEIGDVIVWTTIDGKEGWYKAILDEKNKLTLVYGDEVQTQIPTQEQQVETSWLAKLKTKIAAKRTAAYNKNPKNKAEFYLKEAKAAYEKENLDLAEDYYKLAIAQDPNNAKYYHELGRFYDDVYIDKYYQNLALENYNKAISLDPKNGEYYYSRALLKQYLLKDTPGAINDLAMSMKYGMKGFHTESLFKEWTEDYIKSQKSFQSQTLKPNFEPTAMETDYIPTSYTGAKEKPPRNKASLYENSDAIKGKSDFVDTAYPMEAEALNKTSLFFVNEASYADVFKYIKSTPVKWTEKTAENWLKEQGFSKNDINDVLRACYKGKDFNSDIFELFVKGYKIKPDKSLSIMALSYSLGNNLLSYFSEIGAFNYQKYSKIYTIAKRAPQINFGAIIDYLDATPEQVEALCYAAENFPDVNPTEIMDLATTASLYFKTNNFNFGNYERIINWLKEGISFDSIKKIFETCLTKNYTIDEKTFSKIDKIAKVAITKRNNFLPAKYRNQMNDVTIKNFIYHLAPEILEFLELTDEATLIAAMDYKMDKFEDFVNAGAMLRDNFRGAYNSEVKEQFFEIFYPEKSKKAQELESKISELKSRFSDTPASELQNLKNEINTYTRQLRNLIEQGKEFSPQEKIEMIAIMSRFDGFELEELLESVKQVKTDGIKVWNKKIFDSLVSSLGPKYNMRVEEKLHLLQSPYLRHFFRSIYNKVSFGDRFYELLPLLSGEDFGKALDTLPHNIATKEIFDKYNLDYQKYTNPKVFPSETFYESNNLVEIRQVDMRDISKSLFLGNESGACCAMGGTHPEYAVPYITNTFVGAIEVLVNGRSVGNTMIYPILVLGDKGQEIALLIDDLKIKSPYNQHKYLQKVVGVAKDIAKNIGIKNGKVYISDATIPDYEKSKLGTDTRFYLIGESGDSIWLNAIYNTSQAGSESTYKVTLVPCEKIK